MVSELLPRIFYRLQLQTFFVEDCEMILSRLFQLVTITVTDH